MKTNTNSKSNFSLANIIVLVFSLVGMAVIINWISNKVSSWLVDLLIPKKDEIKKSITREVVDIDQVPERIREKIESYEEAQKTSGTKTFINGNVNVITALTGANNIDQFIYDCKALKRSKIGSHRVPDDDLNSHWDINYAKLVKKNLTQAEEDWAKSFEEDGFTRSRALEFTNKYFSEVNNYIRNLNVNVEQVSFEETDSIVNKYFGEI